MTRLDWRPAQVIYAEQAARDMVALGLRPEEWIPHAAGQHYELRFPGEELSRKFSIVSSPQRTGELEFGVQILPDGMLSPRLAKCRAGDRLEVRGPSGVAFAWRPADGGPLVLLGGGAGITPLLGIRDHHASSLIDSPLIFVLSAGSPERVYRADTCGDVVVRFTGRDGRIDREFLARVLAPALGDPLTRARVCGPVAFMDAMVDHLIDLGIDADRIRSEAFV